MEKISFPSRRNAFIANVVVVLRCSYVEEKGKEKKGKGKGKETDERMDIE